MSTFKALAKPDELIDLVYQGPLEDEPWMSFLKALRARTGCQAVTIAFKLPKSGLEPLILTDQDPNMHIGMDTAPALKLSAKLGHLDPLRNALTKPGDIFTLDEVIGKNDLKKSEFYREVMHPYNIQYALGMHIREPSGWECDIGLMNGPKEKNFGKEEKALFINLCPHIERALALYVRIQRNESERQIFSETLDRLTIGTFILDAEGTIIGCNRVARELSRSHIGIKISDQRIHLLSHQDDVQLSQIIKDAVKNLSDDKTENFVEAMRVDCPSGANFGLLVRSLKALDQHNNDVGPCAIVYVSSPQIEELPLQRFVAKLFGLTPSEALLATMLANGITLSEAATKLEITEQSVRTYTKNLYRKVGVTRQIDLVRLILRSVAILG